MLRGWADALYLIGVRFGTVRARRHGNLLEITTFREERYPEDERKPAVTFAKDIQTDLSSRDFTINAMAVRLPDGEFVDPFEGVKDLAAKRLDTPWIRDRVSRTIPCACCGPRGSSPSLG